MKSIISTTFDDKYLFFVPICTWCWNKIGVDVICFYPIHKAEENELSDVLNDLKKMRLIEDLKQNKNIFPLWDNLLLRSYFSPKHKQATYAQCSRLYGAAIKDLPEDEILITSDVDMCVFNGDYIKQKVADFDIFGSDLVPQKQIPLCYISASVKNWRTAMKTNDRTCQQCLDDLVGVIECEHFRGNQWSLDQGTAYDKILFAPISIQYHFRAKTGTQFATHRLDRDDSFLLDRLNLDIVDYHLPRPGYEEKNFQQIMTVLKYFYPNDNLTWIENYRNDYIKLL